MPIDGGQRRVSVDVHLHFTLAPPAGHFGHRDHAEMDAEEPSVANHAGQNLEVAPGLGPPFPTKDRVEIERVRVGLIGHQNVHVIE